MNLADLQSQLASEQGKTPPVERWDPPFCGDMDLVIKHDGTWHYMGTPIGRKALVKLFASVLKKENDSYFLVTPVEKVGITVEDVPLLVVHWEKVDEHIVFTTITDDRVVVSADNPVQLQQDKTSGDLLPYLLVRRNLFARLHQNVFYQLAEEGQQEELEGQAHLVLHSGNYRFSIGKLD